LAPAGTHVPVAPPRNVTERVNERLAEKAEARKRLRRIALGKWAAAAAVLAAVAWGAVESPALALRSEKVEITGVGGLVSADAISAIVAPHAGTSLAVLDTGAIGEQIRALQGVRDVSIERSWPNGLVVDLDVRIPVAAVPAVEGFTLIDPDGVTVGSAPTAPPGLPVISVPVGEGSARTIAAVVSVLETMPADLLSRISDVSATTEDSIQFTIAGGPLVEWGSSAQSELKAEVLVLLLSSPEVQFTTVIDVSAPTLPTVRTD